MFCFCICSSTPGPQLFLARATTLEIASFTASLALEAVDPTAATSFAFFAAGELDGPVGARQASARWKSHSRFSRRMNCLRSVPASLGGPNLGRTTQYAWSRPRLRLHQTRT